MIKKLKKSKIGIDKLKKMLYNGTAKNLFV